MMNLNNTPQNPGTDSSHADTTDYSAPELFNFGRAATLLQGPMLTGPYKDTGNDYYSNWPTQ